MQLASNLRSDARGLLPRPRQHQRDVVRLLLVADPVVDRRRHELADLRQRQLTVRSHQVDQPLFPEFAEVVFRLGDTVAVGHENFSGLIGTESSS